MVEEIGTYSGYGSHHYGTNDEGNIVVWAHGTPDNASYGPFTFTVDEFETVATLATVDEDIECEVAGIHVAAGGEREAVGISDGDSGKLHLTEFETIIEAVENYEPNSTTIEFIDAEEFSVELPIDADYTIVDEWDEVGGALVKFHSDDTVSDNIGNNRPDDEEYDSDWYFDTAEVHR